MTLINIKALYVLDSHVRHRIVLNAHYFIQTLETFLPVGDIVNSDEEMFVTSLFMCIMSSKSR